MDNLHTKALSIFYPSFLRKINELDEKNMRFVQYTSADAAMSIINNKEIWLRNVQCMNDYLEVNHGINCLVSAFHDENIGQNFKTILDGLFPGIIQEITVLFDSWAPSFRSSSYIACVSEHPPEEDRFGRLSMWRAYGGKRSVALVLNKEAFSADTDVFQAFTHPVSYQDSDNFTVQFGDLSQRIEHEKAFVSSLGKQQVINYLFDLFKTYALCVKHPGFLEEREWRVVYNPKLMASGYVSSSIESIDGVPQEVHKIKLENIPEKNFIGATIPELIDRIIIGPNDQQLVLGNTFVKLLEKAGCENAVERVHYSGIPLR